MEGFPEPVLDEHRALLAEYGRAQQRCSRDLAEQARRIEALQAEVVKLRARALVAETALAYAREDRRSQEEALPGLRRRRALARQVEGLTQRLQNLMREVLHWQWRAAARAGAAHAAGAGKGRPAGRSLPCRLRTPWCASRADRAGRWWHSLSARGISPFGRCRAARRGFQPARRRGGLRGQPAGRGFRDLSDRLRGPRRLLARAGPLPPHRKALRAGGPAAGGACRAGTVAAGSGRGRRLRPPGAGCRLTPWS